MRISKAQRRKLQLQEAGRKGGLSRSQKKITAVRANGRKHVSRVKTLAEIIREAAAKFKVTHPDLFPD
jgi:hypothetical protein